MDLLGRRHALVCVLELRGGSLPFRTLAQRVNASENVVSQRLRELREAGVVEVDEAGDYRLTAEGRRLQGPLEQLAAYAEHWMTLSPRQRVPRGAATHGAGEPDA
jgi:DNA-binding HxlR family transcriptional regulator